MQNKEILLEDIKFTESPTLREFIVSQSPRLVPFFEKHKDDLTKGEFDYLYRDFVQTLGIKALILTEILLESGIDPLSGLQDLIPGMFDGLYIERLRIPGKFGFIPSGFIHSNDYITDLEIGEGITAIKSSAFDRLVRLNHVSFPGTLNEYHYNFSEPRKLSYVEYNGNRKDAHDLFTNAFYGDEVTILCNDGNITLKGADAD